MMMDETKKKEYWKPGDPLTDEDKALLDSIVQKANALGFTPAQSDMKNSKMIKRRFRTWGNAIKAAQLPWVNYPDQQKLRTKAMLSRKKDELSGDE